MGDIAYTVITNDVGSHRVARVQKGFEGYQLVGLPGIGVRWGRPEYHGYWTREIAQSKADELNEELGELQADAAGIKEWGA